MYSIFSVSEKLKELMCVQFIIYCVRLSKLCPNGERINYSERERGFFLTWRLLCWFSVHRERIGALLANFSRALFVHLSTLSWRFN